MADKFYAVPIDTNFHPVKDFVLEQLAGSARGDILRGRLYYDSGLHRIGYAGKVAGAGTTDTWLFLLRADEMESITGSWHFGPADNTAQPFRVTSQAQILNLNASLLNGKPAQSALGADVIPIRTIKTGTQGDEYDGQLVVPAVPADELHAVSKQYVDQQIHLTTEKPAVKVANPRRMVGSYSEGGTTIGSGANEQTIPPKSLYGSSNAAIQYIDGVPASELAVGDRVALFGQGSRNDNVVNDLNSTLHVQNGIYVITDKGSGTTRWILTRAPDFDSDSDIANGATFFVATDGGPSSQLAGDTVGLLGGTQWALLNHGNPRIDADALQFTRTSGKYTSHRHPAADITAGTFRDAAAYNFRRSINVALNNTPTEKTGIWFGNTGTSRPIIYRLGGASGDNRLWMEATPTGTQALFTFISSGSVDPKFKFVRGASSDHGEITFGANQTSHSKPVQLPAKSTTPAAGSIFSKAENGRTHVRVQASSSIEHQLARKVVVPLNGSDSANPIEVIHGLGTKDIIVQIRNDSGKEIIAETTFPNAAESVKDDKVLITFASQFTGTYQCTIIG